MTLPNVPVPMTFTVSRSDRLTLVPSGSSPELGKYVADIPRRYRRRSAAPARAARNGQNFNARGLLSLPDLIADRRESTRGEERAETLRDSPSIRIEPSDQESAQCSGTRGV